MVDLAAVPHSQTALRGFRGRSVLIPAMSAGAKAALAALGLAVFLLFVLGILIGVNQANLQARFALIQHSDDVLLQVASIRQDLLRMESDIRAYALTGDIRHIREWHALRTDTEARLNRLEVLVSDNRSQVQRLSALRPAIETWTSRWAPYAETDSPSLMHLRQDLAHDVQYRPAKNIHVALDAFRVVELGLLQQRQSVAQAQATLLTYLSFFIALSAPAFGAAGIYLLFRERIRARNRALQMQLEHSQRLGLMGETASMLAHELNQPLTAAQNYLAVLRRSFVVPEAGQQTMMAQKVEDQLCRAGGILQRLRNFIEKRESDRQPEMPQTLVADAISLLGTIDTSLRLHTLLEPELPLVSVDRVQIQQILVNIIRNAIEAMAQSPQKELWLSVTLTPAGMIEFRLRDCGPGISPAILDRLFRPFTSTKEDGMGLGLSICQRIARDHHGDMWAEAAPGGGAIFCFTLPAAAR